MYEHESRIEVDADGRVPPEVQQGVFERLIAADAAVARRGARVQRRIDAIAADYRDRLRDRLGERKFAGLRDYVSEVRAARAEQRERGGEPADDEARARQRERRREQSLATLERLGIRTSVLERAAARAKRRVARVLPPTTSGRRGDDGGAELGRLLRPEDVPADIRQRKTNPWTIVTPPYPAQSSHTEGSSSGVAYSRTDHLDRTTGLVGSKVNLDDDDASDFDGGWKERHTRVGFWYQMPATGLVEVWIEAQSAFSRHALRLYDEFGWSTCDVNQYSYLTMQTVVAGSADAIRLSEVTSFTVDDKTDGHWDLHPLVDGATYWTHLFSATPYKPGTWVWVRIGSIDYNYVLTNDVEVHSALDFRWFLKSVHLEAS